jgi:hypothetical protein
LLEAGLLVQSFTSSVDHLISDRRIFGRELFDRSRDLRELRRE